MRTSVSTDKFLKVDSESNDRSESLVVLSGQQRALMRALSEKNSEVSKRYYVEFWEFQGRPSVSK